MNFAYNSITFYAKLGLGPGGGLYWILFHSFRMGLLPITSWGMLGQGRELSSELSPKS